MVYLYGASGHGKVILEIFQAGNIEVGGFIDDNPSAKIRHFPTYSFPGPINLNEDEILISIGDNSIRRKIAQGFRGRFISAIHPKSIISSTVKIGQGTAIMGGAVINADSQIGRHVIINSQATVDHDCIIDDFVHIAPGVVLCGAVHIGEETLVGAGSVILPGIRVGKQVIIGAGTVVIKDVPDRVTLVGNPGKII